MLANHMNSRRAGASSLHTWRPRFVRGKLLPWPCNMWHLVPRRSSRKRSGHRQTSQVAAAPIIFSRLPGALSTRSADAPERQNPGFIAERREFASLQRVCSFRNSLLPCRQSGKGEKKKTETERTWAPAAPPSFPDDAGIRAAGVHRSHLRCHFSLNSTGTVRKIGVSSRGRSGGGEGGVLLSCPYGETTRRLRPASVRPCAPQLLILVWHGPSRN